MTQQSRIYFSALPAPPDGHEVLDGGEPIWEISIIGINVFRDIFSIFRDFFGGRVAGYGNAADEATKECMQRLERKVRLMGYHAVLGVNIDVEAFRGSMFMVKVSGQAVRLTQKRRS